MVGFKVCVGKASAFGRAMSAMVPLCQPEPGRLQQMYVMDSIYLRVDTAVAGVTLWATDFRRMYVYQPKTESMLLKAPDGRDDLIEQWLLPRKPCESLGELFTALPDQHDLELDTNLSTFTFRWGPHKWEVTPKTTKQAMYDHYRSYPTDEPYTRGFVVDADQLRAGFKRISALGRKANKLINLNANVRISMSTSGGATTDVPLFSPSGRITMDFYAPQLMDAVEDAASFGGLVQVSVPDKGNKGPYRITPVDHPRAEFLVWPAI
jgi:hypothetical protein